MLHTRTYRRRRLAGLFVLTAAAALGGYIFLIGVFQLCFMWGLAAG